MVGPDGLLLVRYGAYYPAIARLLPYLLPREEEGEEEKEAGGGPRREGGGAQGRDPSLEDLLAGLEHAGLTIRRLPPEAWQVMTHPAPTHPGGGERRGRLRCRTAGLP